MAYSDIQDRLGQQQMANSVLLAEKYSQGNLFPKGSDENPHSKEPRAEGARKKRKFKKDQEAKKKAKEVSDNARQREWNARKERGEVFGDMPPDFNLMETLGPSLNKLLQIGGAVGGGLRFLTNPLGNSMASTPQDGKIPTRLFYNRPYDQPDVFIKDEQTKEDAKERFKDLTGIDLALTFEEAGLGDGGFVGTSRTNVFINSGGEAYILEPNGNFKFDGLYAPDIHGPIFPRAQANDDMKIAKLPHSPPVEKIVLPNGKIMDSPLRFKTDEQRIRLMEDFSRAYGRYS